MVGRGVLLVHLVARVPSPVVGLVGGVVAPTLMQLSGVAEAGVVRGTPVLAGGPQTQGSGCREVRYIVIL